MTGINSTSLSQHTKFFPNPNPPCQRSEVAPNEHGCPMAPPSSVNTWLEIRITFTSVLRWHSHPGMLNHISGVEWSQFSSATRLGAFLTSLKAAQVISCPRLNPFHLLQLYWQLSTEARALWQDQVPCISRCATSILAPKRTGVIESHLSNLLSGDSFSAELSVLVEMLNRLSCCNSTEGNGIAQSIDIKTLPY